MLLGVRFGQNYFMLRYFELIRYQIYANLKAETARGGLGILWWIVEPILYMSVFFIVFKYVLHRGGDGFIPFLITGLTVWKWFASSVMQGAMSIQSGAGLMRQVHVSKFFFPLVTVLTGTFKFLIVLFLLIVFLVALGTPISVSWVSLPILVITQLLFILFISGLFSVIMPFFLDLRLVLENALILGLFMSGTFYDIEDATGTVKTFLKLNPMANLMVEYRTVLIQGGWPDFVYLAFLAFLSLLGLCFVFYLIRRFDRIFPKIIA